MQVHESEWNIQGSCAQVHESGSKMYRPRPIVFGRMVESFDEWIMAWRARRILARIVVAVRHRSGCSPKIEFEKGNTVKLCRGSNGAAARRENAGNECRRCEHLW